ncbi:MAG TPA: isochorismate synthase [Myxococcaceae bacterium]|nr:isochorismate synthase [Myxococcaceae bacterium]
MTHPAAAPEVPGEAWTLPLGEVRPLAAAQVLGPPSLYWARETDGQSIAGFGVAATLGPVGGDAALLDRLTADVQRRRERAPGTRLPPLVWLGGLGFGPSAVKDPRWEPFGTARFQLPRLAIWRAEGGSHVTAFDADPDRARTRAEEVVARLGAARLSDAEPPPASPGPGARVEVDRAGWQALHARALATIASGALEKVVLARPIDLEGDGGGLIPVLARLEADGQQGTLFAFEGTPGTWFVGLSPELLVRVEDRVVFTEAIAGTARQGAGDSLLSDERMLREQGAVVEAIRAGLTPLCEELRIPDRPGLLTLRDLVHLRTPVEGRLREGTSLDAVVASLHPTPATGGTPRARALAFLSEHEGLDRGWYAGALGGVGPRGLHLSVGLRSALLHPGGVRLFVGAGVVAGSTADFEWLETETKARPMMRAVGHPIA